MNRAPVITSQLGRTGLQVPRLGIGTYQLSGAGVRTGATILRRAFELGVCFWDTSDDYGSHPHIAAALARVPRDGVVVSTKTYARTALGARRSLGRSLRELRTDYVDLFLLHCVTRDWIDGFASVLEALGEEKRRGRVRAVGLSTHSVTVARASAGVPPAEVLMAPLWTDAARFERSDGLFPVEDGTPDAMHRAVRSAHRRGKGTIAIKVLGSGSPFLTRHYGRSLRAIDSLPYVDALVVGIADIDELERDVRTFMSGDRKLNG